MAAGDEQLSLLADRRWSAVIRVHSSRKASGLSGWTLTTILVKIPRFLARTTTTSTSGPFRPYGHAIGLAASATRSHRVTVPLAWCLSSDTSLRIFKAFFAALRRGAAALLPHPA